MESHARGSKNSPYSYIIGINAIHKGKIINLADQYKDNLEELKHFVIQNSNYRWLDFESIDIREFLRIVSLVEKDIERKSKQ